MESRGTTGAGAFGGGKPRRGFTGSTSRAYGSAILGAPFWQPGKEIGGFYIGSFETANGQCYKFKCGIPSKLTVIVDEAGRVVPEDTPEAKSRDIDQFAMGALAGFEMAMDDMKANGWKGFQLHDKVWIKCTEMQDATQPGYAPMLMFEVTVEA